MSTSKILLFVACSALLGVATTTRGEDTSAIDLKDRHGMLLQPNGQVKILRSNDTSHAMVMKEGRPLPAGAIVYRSGNQLYVLEDRKMTDGKMMFETVMKDFADH
jgi:hypothetical protein